MSHAVHSMELCRIEILTTSYSLQSVLRIARLSQRVISCVTLSEQPLDTSEKDGATERDNNVRCVSLISISLMQSGRNRSRLINTCNYVSYDDRLFSAEKGDDVFLFVSQGNGHDQNNLVRVSKQKKTKGEKMHVCASPTVSHRSDIVSKDESTSELLQPCLRMQGTPGTARDNHAVLILCTSRSEQMLTSYPSESK